MKFIVIIPARYQSTRFPGKPLAMIGNKTMIQRVVEQASKACDDVYVATDDARIADAVTGFGGKVVLTRNDHKSGTDRLREAADKILDGSNDTDSTVIINVQGDEPFISPSQIESVKDCFADHTTSIATIARPFDSARGFTALEDPNVVKLTMSSDGHALYFSRSVIPYVRGSEPQQWPSEIQYYCHVGLYAYRYSTLREITELTRSPLEIAESLEQLRWLENGYRIKVAITNLPTIGIDTPADLEEACKYLKDNA